MKPATRRKGKRLGTNSPWNECGVLGWWTRRHDCQAGPPLRPIPGSRRRHRRTNRRRRKSLWPTLWLVRHIDIDSLVMRAEEIATVAHRGQRDKAGKSYIDHPRRVANRVRAFGPVEVAAAWLHDVLEDCDVTASDLSGAGFPPSVVEAVQAMTKQPREDHEAAVRRACANPVAKVVKAADVADNSDPIRLSLLDAATAKRLTLKYAAARRLLDEARAPQFVRPESTPSLQAYDDAVDSTRNANPDWRLGQTMYNVLAEMRPDLANQVNGADLDPFHRDSVIEALREWLADNW